MLQRLRPLARWPGACSGAVLGVQTCMLPASLSAAAGMVRIAPVAPPAAGGGAGWPRSGQTEGGSAGPRPVARHFFPLTSYFYSAPSDEGAVSRRLTEGEIPPGLQVCARRTNGAGAKAARSKSFSLLKARRYLSFRRYRGTSSRPKSRRFAPVGLETRLRAQPRQREANSNESRCSPLQSGRYAASQLPRPLRGSKSE